MREYKEHKYIEEMTRLNKEYYEKKRQLDEATPEQICNAKDKIKNLCEDKGKEALRLKLVKDIQDIQELLRRNK